MAFFVATLTYREPLEKIEAATADHRAWSRRLHEEGRLVASGPFSPRTGGMLLLRATDRDEVDLMLCDDPFLDRGLVTYDVHEWVPVLGASTLGG